jgi:hypothetical protein
MSKCCGVPLRHPTKISFEYYYQEQPPRRQRPTAKGKSTIDPITVPGVTAGVGQVVLTGVCTEVEVGMQVEHTVAGATAADVAGTFHAVTGA